MVFMLIPTVITLARVKERILIAAREKSKAIPHLSKKVQNILSGFLK